MTPKEYINRHTVAVDYNNGETVQMIAKSTAEKACDIAVRDFARTLCSLPIDKAMELAEKVAHHDTN